MKIQIASDLHLEKRRDYEPELHDFFPVEDRDVLVLAGDIGTYMQAWSFIEQELRRSPVIYVPGNHEYYSCRPESMSIRRGAARHGRIPICIT